MAAGFRPLSDRPLTRPSRLPTRSPNFGNSTPFSGPSAAECIAVPCAARSDAVAPATASGKPLVRRAVSIRDREGLLVLSTRPTTAQPLLVLATHELEVSIGQRASFEGPHCRLRAPLLEHDLGQPGRVMPRQIDSLITSRILGLQLSHASSHPASGRRSATTIKEALSWDIRCDLAHPGETGGRKRIDLPGVNTQMPTWTRRLKRGVE